MRLPRLNAVNQLQVLIIFFTGVILYCERYHGSDGQLFQVFAGILTGLTGVYIGYGKQQLGVHDEPPLPPGSKRVIAGSVTEETAQPEGGATPEPDPQPPKK